MASESCAICGEEADADEIDPHGHFDTDDVPCIICDELPEDHFIVGQKLDHEYESGI